MGIDLPSCDLPTTDLIDGTSFKSILVTLVPMDSPPTDVEMGNPSDTSGEETHELPSNFPTDYPLEDSILLFDAEKERIYRLWSYSVIIKLLGKKMNHEYLKRKLATLWRPTEEIILTDLGDDYYIVKFLKEENMIVAMQKGPWFANGFFLSVKKWHPNLVASEADETVSTVWIRLPELPTEYYDHKILENRQ